MCGPGRIPFFLIRFRPSSMPPTNITVRCGTRRAAVRTTGTGAHLRRVVVFVERLCQGGADLQWLAQRVARRTDDGPDRWNFFLLTLVRTTQWVFTLRARAPFRTIRLNKNPVPCLCCDGPTLDWLGVPLLCECAGNRNTGNNVAHGPVKPALAGQT